MGESVPAVVGLRRGRLWRRGIGRAARASTSPATSHAVSWMDPAVPGRSDAGGG